MSASNGREQRDCFVIAPIGEPDSETRDHSDKVLKYLVTPVVEPRGYAVERADRLGKPGFITSQVITRCASVT